MAKGAKQTPTGQVLSAARQLGEPVASRMGLDLWDLEFVKEGGVWTLRYTLDGPDGVDLDACEAFSRTVDAALDDADPIAGSYRLEVCSAGLDRALKRPGDFARFAGSAVDVHLYAPLGGSCDAAAGLQFSVSDNALPAACKRFEATLLQLEQGVLTLRDDAGRDFALPLAAAARVRLAVRLEND